MKSASIRPASMTRPRFQQIATEPWPHGLSQAIAVLSAEPEEMRDSLGIEFTDSHDGLDYTRSAILQLPSEAQVALVRHQGCQSPGTEVWIHQGAVEPRRLLDELLRALTQDKDALKWTHPALSAP